MSGLNWIDPLHALKLGWLNARAFKLQGRGTLQLATMDRAGDAAILYDPSLGTREYFIITRYSYGGINVWRIVEDEGRMRRSPWAAAYKNWIGNPLGWGRWAIHRVTTDPLKQGERVRLDLTTGSTGFYLTVEQNRPEGNLEPVSIRLER